MNTQRLGLLVAWLLATTASVALAYEGVDLVRDQVVERPLPVLRRAAAPQPAESATADVLENLLAVEEGLSDEVPEATDATGSDDGTDPTDTTGPESTVATAPDSTDSTVPDTAPPPAEQSTTTVPAPPPEPPPGGNNQDGQLEEQTYRLHGGTVTIRVGSGFVRFVSAIPTPGYQIRVVHTGSEQVEVEFYSEYRVSTLEAHWAQDTADVTLTEDLEVD